MLSTLKRRARVQWIVNLHRRRPVMPRPAPLPACSICNKPVQLETSKTDENGSAVHEECYVLKLTLKQATIPSPRT